MKQPSRPFLIVITGGIASGKSVVSKWFEKHDFPVFYTDKIGHELFEEQYFKNEIEKIVGSEVIINNSIDRVKLGEIIFSSKDKRKQLNELLHPEIIKRIQLIIDTSSNKIIIFEIPLLFENNLNKAFDLVINIWTDEETQLRRLMNRKMMTREKAMQQISSQMPTNEKREKADINIENTSTIYSLKNKLSNLQSIIDKRKFKEVINCLNIKRN